MKNLEKQQKLKAFTYVKCNKNNNNNNNDNNSHDDTVDSQGKHHASPLNDWIAAPTKW